MAAKYTVFPYTMTVQLEDINHLLKLFPIMPSVTYYAQNYAGIIGWSLMKMVRLVGIMLQISIIILFRISLKLSSLCSILFFLCY